MSDLKAPVLLVAMPQVLDPFFHRGVVLLIRHEESEGSFGFLVNRPSDIRVSEILQGMEVAWRGGEEAVAYFGGPVQRQLGTVLFSPGPEAAGSLTGVGMEVSNGVALTQHVGDLTRLAETPPDHFRLLLGYAGWGDGQLLEEILRNDWLTVPVARDLVFAPDPERVWEAALQSVGVDPLALPSWRPEGGGEETTN
ncbi:MAG TPA: YqgE/AlgH family protein [Thermoanaerobaculia bacterium]